MDEGEDIPHSTSNTEGAWLPGQAPARSLTTPSDPNPTDPSDQTDQNNVIAPGDSPYAPRAAEKTLELPHASDRDHLRLATAEIVQHGVSITEAAKKYDVDPDTLFIWHRTYLNFIGRDLASLNQGRSSEKVEFDRDTNRKFDHNWAEMLHEWELSRPQLSPIRKKLLASPFTRWMFRGEQVDKITLTGAAAAIAFSALAIRAGTNHLGETDPAKDPASATVNEDVNPADPSSIVGESQNAVLKKVASALENFAKLESWQERLDFVRSPEEAKPLMAAYYREHPDGPLKNLVINPQISFLNRDEKIFVLIQAHHTPDAAEFGEPKPIIFLAEAQEGEPAFLFDWEILVNYEPKPWEEFVAEKSSTPATYRMRVSKSDYYNKPFMDADKFVSYTLAPLHRENRAYGFVEKGSPLAKKLEEVLAKELNQNRAMILSVSFPAEAKFNNILKIEEIVADGWLEE